jgi:hypothetical protein
MSEPGLAIAPGNALGSAMFMMFTMFRSSDWRWLEPLLSSMEHSPREVFGSKGMLAQIIREKNWEFIDSSSLRPA